MDTGKETKQQASSVRAESKVIVTLVHAEYMPYDESIPEEPIQEVGYILLVVDENGHKTSTVEVVVSGTGQCLIIPFTAARFLSQYGRDGVDRLCKQVPILGRQILEAGVEIGL